MKNRIYIANWLEFKPYAKQVKTDNYYLKICNNVNKILYSNKYNANLEEYLENDELDWLSCFLTSYFEDIISGTNIWNTFVSEHKKLYNKQLPFYNLDEYYEKEINPQDIKFLLWYFINTLHDDLIITPIDTLFEDLANDVMEVFENEWEYAPENEYLKSLYEIDENETDFYIIRNQLEIVLIKSYLFFPDTTLRLRELYNAGVEKSRVHDETKMYLYEALNMAIHFNTKLLSYNAKEWYAAILGNESKLAKDILNISPKIQGHFLYKGSDEYNIIIEHINTGRQFNVTKKSFHEDFSIQKIDEILKMNIIRWKDEWWFTGLLAGANYDQEFVEKEKNEPKDKTIVDIFENKKAKTQKVLQLYLSIFKDFTGGKQIVFMTSDKINEFGREYIKYYNKRIVSSLTLRKKKKQEISEKNFERMNSIDADFDPPVPTVVFFNVERGVEFAIEVNSAFPDDDNPYYNSDNSTEDIMELLKSKDFSKELFFYCVDNYKDKLDFFNNDEIGKLYLKDIDFLLRFCKVEEYHKEPALSFA